MDLFVSVNSRLDNNKAAPGRRTPKLPGGEEAIEGTAHGTNATVFSA